MMQAVAALTAAVAVALGASPPPVPAPPAASPTVAPNGADLPEIGRVRSTTPVCAAMRDLVIPAFNAAQRADARFLQTRSQLPRYAEIAADREHKDGVFRDSALAKLDADANAMQNEALALEKALHDPRLTTTTDPQVIAERKGIEALYAVQKARANQLQEFVMRERIVTVRNGMQDSKALQGRHAPASQAAEPAPQSAAPPPLNVPRGMPILTGISALADKASLNEWSLNMAAAVRAGENDAAKSFMPIARDCG